MVNNNSTRVLVLLALSSALTFGQNSAPLKVIVGDPIVDGAKLRPYQNQWIMTMIKPDGSVVRNAGNWKDELKEVQVEGKTSLQRTQLATFKKSNGEVGAATRTVNVFDPSTL